MDFRNPGFVFSAKRGTLFPFKFTSVKSNGSVGNESMKGKIDRLLFDAADRELLNAVDEALAAGRSGGGRPPEFAVDLHPRGIRELAEPRAVRMTRTMLRLLDTFEAGIPAMEERLAALQALRDEVIEGLDVLLRCNTARALLQVIKDLVRERHDPLRRLRLAHDMRTAMLGNPLFIRRLLRRYHLVEMPESWTPVTFDQHVHDANTKGRKSPTHLIMDAWIKGIVKLQVVYYNYVPREAAEELLRAARIMQVDVRIGVEFRSLYRGRFVEMIWTPRGFSGVNDFLKFLDRPGTAEFTRKCRKAANFRRRIVLEILDRFNRGGGRKKLNAFYGIDLPPVSREEFLASVQYGQPSVEHIGELLVTRVRAELQRRLAELEENPDSGALPRMEELRARIGALSGELLRARYLDLSLWELPPARIDDLPEINRCSPWELIQELRKVASGFRMTLNLSGLRLEDVIEILYDCRGEITALEIFNLKDEIVGGRPDGDLLNRLRHALNTGSVFKLKDLIRQAIARVSESDRSDRDDRVEKLRTILRDMSGFLEFYQRAPLEASLGSDSASRPSRFVHGMGFAVVDTLPTRVRRLVRHGLMPDLKLLRVTSSVYRELSFLPRESEGAWGRLGRSFGFGYDVRVRWICPDPALKIDRGTGNLATLGGFSVPSPETPLVCPVASPGEFWHYLNSNVKIAVKILAGFLAAFLTFYYGSYDWWFLTWFGAVVWLGITAVRNIIQSVFAGGGLRSSPLLKWNDFISWQRVADSLFYTGLSVPVLDWLVKTLILNDLLGWTAERQPVLVFTGIALANGFYIMGHNLLRAFPKSAVWGNWLRAPLSIPLAVFFNFLLGSALSLLGVRGIEMILQQWAAILSKLASDVIGGVIEARADRARNIAARMADLRTKLRELFALVSRLELLLPEADLPELMRSRDMLPGISELKRNNLMKLFYVNALDIMYIWMRQPQAVTAMRRIMSRLSSGERLQFVKSQEILKREKSISKMFLSGLFGKHFTRPLAFYLAYYREYLQELREFDPTKNPDPPSASPRSEE